MFLVTLLLQKKSVNINQTGKSLPIVMLFCLPNLHLKVSVLLHSVMAPMILLVIVSAVPRLGGTASVVGCSHIATNPSSHRAQMSISFVDT